MIKSAILLVGGMGTRMQPLTFDTPKPMLPLVGKPITEHQIIKARDAGITEIVLATSYLSEVFTPYFGLGEKLGIKISYAVEESALGTGGAIRNAAKLLDRDGPVIIFNGDVLSDHSLTAQIESHIENEADVTLYLTEVEDARAFGVVELSGNRITSFNEKMENPPTKIINAGCYIFNREIIESIPQGTVVSVEREVFPNLLSKGARVIGFVDRSYWLDIGNPGALLKATRDLIERSGNLKATGFEVMIDESAVIDEGSYIGDGAKVGPGARLHQCIVGKGATIGANVDLTRVFVADRYTVSDNYRQESGFLGFPSS